MIAQMPDWPRGRGCDLYRFDFATGRETRIATANSPGASEFLPSVWKATVAFARVYERKRGLKGERAYLYARPIAGAGPLAQADRGIAFRAQVLHRRQTAALHAARGAGSDGARSLRPAARVRVGLREQRNRRRRRCTSRRCWRAAASSAGGSNAVDSGEIQAAELLSPQVDQDARVVWGRALFGDT